MIPLIRCAQALKVACYLPIVPPRGQRRLWFVKLTRPIASLDRGGRFWRRNQFGISEYHPPQRRWQRAHALQKVFVPLLGFDAEGYRLGMGGGYYDASLAFRRWRAGQASPRVIGLGFSCQGTLKLPHDGWDIPLDAVLTESGLLRPRRG